MSMSVFYLILSASFTNIIVLSVDQVFAKDTTETVITIHFSNPSFSTIHIDNLTFTQIAIPDCFMNGSTGDPLMPLYPVHVLIPHGKKLSDIRIQTSEPLNYSQHIRDAPLFPTQLETPFSDPQNGTDFSLNESTYTSKEPVKSSRLSNHGQGTLKGYPILTLNLYPLEYTPHSSTLYFYSDMTITITWSRVDQKGHHPFLRGDRQDRNFVASFVDNPEDINSYDQQVLSVSKQGVLGSSPLSDEYSNGLCGSSETVEYVIVTSDDLSDTTGYEYNWTDLIQHRENLDGFTGRIVTVESIDACSDYWNSTALFNDSAAHLREFCKDAYLDWNTQYVLLGGTWETSDASKQIVPCRVLEDIYETLSFDTMPSDLYFSNLDGDWYDEANGVWGGGRARENDKYSELSVGRLAVWDAEMISNSIDKIIWYDTCTNESFLRSAAFLGGNLGWTSTSKEYMEEIRVGDGAWAQYEGFEEWNTAYPDYAFDTTGRYYDEDYPTESDAVNAWKNAINNNEISMISHLDHGSRLNTLSLGTGSELSNTNFFIGTSQACLSGRYIDGNSGASSFISSWDDKGAFAMVINTGYGYGTSSSTYGASQQQHKIFWDYFFDNQSDDLSNWQLGNALRYTKDIFSAVIDYSSSYCYVWYSWNLFGDPAQTLHITPLYQDPSIESLSPENGSVDVDVSINFTVDISDDDLLNWSITCSNGQTSSDTLDEPGTKYLSLTNLSFNTSYMIWVNVTDGENWAREQSGFTTRLLYQPICPNDCQITSINRTCIEFSWTSDALSDTVRIERNISSSWSMGKGDLVGNTSGSSFSDSGLSPDTTYYYQLWSWNTTDKVYSVSNATLWNTTASNNLPVLSDFSVSNGSTNVSVDVNWTSVLSDIDGDEIEWTMNCSSGENKSGIEQGSGSVWMVLKDLFYNTTYVLWINATDEFDTVSYWYTFTTTTVEDTFAPSVADITVEYSTAKDILIGWENISCSVTDVSIIEAVTITFTLPNGSYYNDSLAQVTGADTYFLNTTFQQSGNYTFSIRAVESNGFETVSDIQTISLAPNWDVNEEGICNLADITIISEYYGQMGSEGWIRADVDNNGEIQVLDFVASSNHYGEGWW